MTGKWRVEMKIGDGLYYYKGLDGTPLWGMCTSNSYVIRGKRGKGLTLTDPGPAVGPRRAQLMKAIAGDGLSFKDVRRVFLTHTHQDHIMMPGDLEKKWGIRFYCHELDLELLRDPKSFWRAEIETLGDQRSKVLPPLPVAIMNLSVTLLFGPTRPFANAITIADGDQLDCGVPAFVVSLPGHRPGEIGLHLPEHKTLITGDLLNYKRYDLPSINLPLSDFDDVMASIEKVKTFDIEMLCPAHDMIMTGRKRIIKWCDDSLARCEKMRSRVAAECDKNPNFNYAALGKELIGNTEGASVMEYRPLVFSILRSLDRKKLESG